ncbi:hypothetical protein [Mycoplasma crocodyli]|uniref:Uncharacterized protein n=1 Tax=Mycoplasma crocodyli (strain ATCC 51981 / MP145) TaxID=512564 RepID=D5E589_MYCCM|nr:hypothetical protein [Mycoplasma crocodyli]ADE19572.1 hypothetical protein MCRO_0280 [Mycoplasma crocodyli MP145]
MKLKKGMLLASSTFLLSSAFVFATSVSVHEEARYKTHITELSEYPYQQRYLIKNLITTSSQFDANVNYINTPLIFKTKKVNYPHSDTSNQFKNFVSCFDSSVPNGEKTQNLSINELNSFEVNCDKNKKVKWFDFVYRSLDSSTFTLEALEFDFYIYDKSNTSTPILISDFVTKIELTNDTGISWEIPRANYKIIESSEESNKYKIIFNNKNITNNYNKLKTIKIALDISSNKNFEQLTLMINKAYISDYSFAKLMIIESQKLLNNLSSYLSNRIYPPWIKNQVTTLISSITDPYINLSLEKYQHAIDDKKSLIYGVDANELNLAVNELRNTQKFKDMFKTYKELLLIKVKELEDKINNPLNNVSSLYKASIEQFISNLKIEINSKNDSQIIGTYYDNTNAKIDTYLANYQSYFMDGLALIQNYKTNHALKLDDDKKTEFISYLDDKTNEINNFNEQQKIEFSLAKFNDDFKNELALKFDSYKLDQIVIDEINKIKTDENFYTKESFDQKVLELNQIANSFSVEHIYNTLQKEVKLNEIAWIKESLISNFTFCKEEREKVINFDIVNSHYFIQKFNSGKASFIAYSSFLDNQANITRQRTEEYINYISEWKNNNLITNKNEMLKSIETLVNEEKYKDYMLESKRLELESTINEFKNSLILKDENLIKANEYNSFVSNDLSNWNNIISQFTNKKWLLETIETEFNLDYSFYHEKTVGIYKKYLETLKNNILNQTDWTTAQKVSKNQDLETNKTKLETNKTWLNNYIEQIQNESYLEYEEESSQNFLSWLTNFKEALPANINKLTRDNKCNEINNSKSEIITNFKWLNDYITELLDKNYDIYLSEKVELFKEYLNNLKANLLSTPKILRVEKELKKFNINEQKEKLITNKNYLIELINSDILANYEKYTLESEEKLKANLNNIKRELIKDINTSVKNNYISRISLYKGKMVSNVNDLLEYINLHKNIQPIYLNPEYDIFVNLLDDTKRKVNISPFVLRTTADEYKRTIITSKSTLKTFHQDIKDKMYSDKNHVDKNRDIYLPQPLAEYISSLEDLTSLFNINYTPDIFFVSQYNQKVSELNDLKKILVSYKQDILSHIQKENLIDEEFYPIDSITTYRLELRILSDEITPKKETLINEEKYNKYKENISAKKHSLKTYNNLLDEKLTNVSHINGLIYDIDSVNKFVEEIKKLRTEIKVGFIKKTLYDQKVVEISKIPELLVTNKASYDKLINEALSISSRLYVPTSFNAYLIALRNLQAKYNSKTDITTNEFKVIKEELNENVYSKLISYKSLLIKDLNLYSLDPNKNNYTIESSKELLEEVSKINALISKEDYEVSLTNYEEFKNKLLLFKNKLVTNKFELLEIIKKLDEFIDKGKNLYKPESVEKFSSAIKEIKSKVVLYDEKILYTSIAINFKEQIDKASALLFNFKEQLLKDLNTNLSNDYNYATPGSVSIVNKDLNDIKDNIITRSVIEIDDYIELDKNIKKSLKKLITYKSLLINKVSLIKNKLLNDIADFEIKPLWDIDLQLYSQKSIDTLVNKINTLLKDYEKEALIIIDSTYKNESVKLDQLIKELYSNKDDLNQTIDKAKDIDLNQYSPESYSEFILKINTISDLINADSKITHNKHRSYIEQINNINDLLISYKKKTLTDIETLIFEVANDRTKYKNKAYEKFDKNINDLKSKVSNNNNVLKNDYYQYNDRIKTIKSYLNNYYFNKNLTSHEFAMWALVVGGSMGLFMFLILLIFIFKSLLFKTKDKW